MKKLQQVETHSDKVVLPKEKSKNSNNEYIK